MIVSEQSGKDMNHRGVSNGKEIDSDRTYSSKVSAPGKNSDSSTSAEEHNTH